jgi:hypothetical protein
VNGKLSTILLRGIDTGLFLKEFDEKYM